MSKRRHRRRRDPDSAANRLYLKPGGVWFGDFRDIGAGCKSMGTTDEFTAAAQVQLTFDAIKAEQAKAEATSAEPTLLDLKPLYLEWQLVGRGRPRRPETAASGDRRLQKLIDHFEQDMRLADFTPDVIEGYVAMRRQQAGRKAATVAIQTVLHEVHALSGLIRWAILKGRYGGENPFTKVELPEVVAVEQEYLEPGEAYRFLSAAEAGDPFWRALFAFFLYTGCRNQELRSRLVEDVDFEGGWVRIHPNDFYQLKSKHAKRRVPLWPALRRVLQEYVGDRTSGLLFPSPVNGGMIAAAFARPIERVMQELE
ncbi:MAG: tyrosine-type recombinase/integrase, partial [Gemmatimonadetes bacterium]|nr:tyrosine-type recombinase/integrase [Gemmatimonadota bacterium]